MGEFPPDSSEPESEPEPEPESVLIPWQWIGKACITYLMMSIGAIFLEGVAETAWYIKIKEMILERKVLLLPALFFFLCTLSCLYALITCRGAIEADLEDVDQIVCAIFHSLVNSLRPRMSSLTFPLPWLLTNKRGQKWLWIAGTAGVSVISMVLRNSCSVFSAFGGLEVPASPPSSTVCIGDLPARLPPCPSACPPAARLNYLTPTDAQLHTMPGWRLCRRSLLSPSKLVKMPFDILKIIPTHPEVESERGRASRGAQDCKKH